jgi:sulfur carrier protein
MNRAVNLIVNGSPVTLKATTLAEALAHWMEEDARIEAIGARAVATALNGKFVPAAKRSATPLTAGDRIEILAPMQGG